MARRFPKLLLWGALLIGLAELSARLFLFPQFTAMLPDMYGRHPLLGHYNKADLEVRRYNPMNYDVINHTNALGMRGLEKDRERELAGVWVAGGSNTFGGYVEDGEVFSAALRKYGIWAANLASEGHTIERQAVVIRALAKEGYRPKAVVLTLSMYFSIADYSFAAGILDRPLDALLDNLRKAPPRAPTARENLSAAVGGFGAALPANLKAMRARLLKSSALYGWLKVGIMGIPALRGWTLRNGLRSDVDLVRNYDLDLLRPLGPGNPALGMIRSTADLVADIGKMVGKTFGVPFGVVILPANHQLHSANFARFVDHYGLSGEDLDPLRPLAALENALRERNVPALDTLPALRESGVSRLTFPDDGHLTAAAHAIVAKALADWLKREILPGAAPDEKRS